MTLPAAARRVIAEHGLVPHPEGGWYRETGRTTDTVATPSGRRPLETAIEFLLAEGQVSRLHRLRQDEVWTHLAGPGLDLHLLAPGHTAAVVWLEAGAEAVTVPAGVWMGAEVRAGGWALVECVCRPGFDFADLEFAARADLLADWPGHSAAIHRLTP
jgi:predicted cupin superfamily sugar epimerase